MKKLDLDSLKGYALPVILGIATIIGGIADKKQAAKNEELCRKIDELSSKLDNEEES